MLFGLLYNHIIYLVRFVNAQKKTRIVLSWKKKIRKSKVGTNVKRDYNDIQLNLNSWLLEFVFLLTNNFIILLLEK